MAAGAALALAAAAQQNIQFVRPRGPALEARLKAVTDDNAARAVEIRKQLSAAGCPEVEEQKVRGDREPNLICRIPGTNGHTIVVGAHYDREGKGSLGAADNWTGAALLATLVENVKGAPRQHDFVFVAFAAEEQGLVGSKRFVKTLPGEQRKRVRAMVNLDTLGLADTKVAVKTSDEELVQRLAQVAQSLNLPVARVDVDQVGTSDSESFLKAGMPAINIHSITQQTWTVLHTKDDQLAALDLPAYERTALLVSAYLAYLDLTPRSAPAPPARGKGSGTP